MTAHSCRRLPTWVSTLDGAHSGVHQCLYLRGPVLPSPARPANASSFRNDSPLQTISALFKLLLSYGVSGWLRLQASLVRALWGVWISAPLVSSARCSGGSSFWYRFQGTWVPDVGCQLFSHPGEAPIWWDPSLLCESHQGWRFWQERLSASPTPVSVVLLAFIVKQIFTSSQVLFRGNWLTGSCIFVVLTGVG